MDMKRIAKTVRIRIGSGKIIITGINKKESNNNRGHADIFAILAIK